MNPEKPTALLEASTGVAAINIDGTTINTALAIPKSTGDVLPANNVSPERAQMRLPLCELKLIIIDAYEIFDTNNSQLFARKSIIALGDLY